MLPRFAIASLAAALASFGPAQTVHLVGSGGFPQIQNAINAANPGDVVVVQAGTYNAFTLNKDLTLTAAPAAIVDINVLPWGSNVSVFRPPGQAKVVGMRFRHPIIGPAQTRVLSGTVHFADCLFESSPWSLPALAALVVQNAQVALQRCDVLGGGAQSTTSGGTGAGGHGMTVSFGTVAAADCTFRGGAIHWDFSGSGGHAIVASAADVHLANCLAVGGGNDPLISYHPTGNGMHIASTSRIWLADCQVAGGNGHTTAGGAALVNLGTTAVVEARSTFTGGPGSPVGPAVIGPLVTGPLLGLLGTTAPITLGVPWTVGYRTTPATPVLVLASDGLAVSVPPVVAEPAWLSAGSFVVAGAGVTDATGLLTFTFPVPATPSLLHAPCFVQGFAGGTLPLRTAPPVGGTVR
ncbi:MAG: hypothetical protein WAT39_22190 [Planctomycetota bacterium]